MEPAIVIEHLSKEYTLKKGAPYIALRDVMSNAFKPKQTSSTFLALNDINLQIEQGERLGIIGANGAGKSTLLKIISRITPPTKGKVVINGRVASLLEVGTGFHPELTGRENIYLNGSILGLTKKEIDVKLEEIIDFSGVETFIDVPLKKYSSGMQLRLAFSVAAHLEPEILLIDEVLAVGDMEFQKKCIGKMEEVSKTFGRTILFVSHNLGFVQNFCTTTLLLQKGEAVAYGNTNEVIEYYLKSLETVRKSEITFGNGHVIVNNFQILDSNSVSEHLLIGHPATFEIEFTALQTLPNIEIAFNIRDRNNEIISHVTSLDKAVAIKTEKGQTFKVSILLEKIHYTPGTYTVDAFILNSDEICWGCNRYTQFSVLNSDKALRPNGFPAHVKTFTDSKWKVQRV